VRQPLDAGPLRERAFRLLFLGQSFSVLGNAIAPIALAFAVLEAGGSATELGLVLAAQSIPTVLFLLAGGVFADRLPRRAVMVGADLVRGGTQATLAALLLTGDAELWHFYALQAANGVATAFFYPASGGLVPETVPAGRLQQANALLSLSRSGGQLTGPAVAGALVATVGPAWGLVADAATFLLSAWFLALMPLAAHSRASIEPFLRELREGWQEFRSRTWLWLGVLYSGSRALRLRSHWGCPRSRSQLSRSCPRPGCPWRTRSGSRPSWSRYRRPRSRASVPTTGSARSPSSRSDSRLPGRRHPSSASGRPSGSRPRGESAPRFSS
jgi:MFS family permease